MRWLHCITDSMDMSLSYFREIARGKEARSAAGQQVTNSQTGLSDRTTTTVTTTSIIMVLFVSFKSFDDLLILLG